MKSDELKAKEYQIIRRRLTIFHLLLTPALLVLILSSGMHLMFREWSLSIAGAGEWQLAAVYFTIFSIFFLLIDVPLSFYSAFLVEHRFGLSNQGFSGWLKDFAKRSLLSFAVSLALVELLYWIIRSFPDTWWLWAWAGYAFVSYILGKLFPVVIVPLFYKYGKVEDEVLAAKIRTMAARFGLPVENVYSLNLSKTTKKANAAFMGIGKTRRVVLSDTLISNFTHEEIGNVVAHELGHYKHGDIWRLLGFGLLVSLLAFYAGSWGMGRWAPVFGIDGTADIAGLPLLFLIFYVVNFLLMPAQNAYSRRRERAADRFALEVCREPETFVSCMEKLGRVNLSEMEPPPWFEWFFYDHPSLSKRIRVARHFGKGEN
ncbi:MAG: hypothetical protein BWY42_00557 [Candidatus Omnitrophica bacterium ADurb.Bin277]|nr:MAG: hypothetical protein BWY42_00557 [Candidatus Omnitrophica bacterium ADurb.Bin277]